MNIAVALFLGLRAAGVSGAFAGGRSGASPAPGVSETSSGRVQAVADTLKDLYTSIENDEKKETLNYDQYIQWCQTRIQAIDQGLGESKDALGTGEVSESQLNASIASLRQKLDEADAEITAVNDAMAQASNIRGDEHDQYSDDLQTNTQSIAQVTEAVRIVGNVHGQGGFVQKGALRRLQLNEPGESSYVLGIMKGLKARLEKGRAAMQSAEARLETQDSAFMSTKKKQLSSLLTQSSTRKQILQEQRVSLVSVEHDVKSLMAEISDLSTALRATSYSCDKKVREWKVRSEDRVNEKAALRQAINYLDELLTKVTATPQDSQSKDGSSFLQTRAASRRAFTDGSALVSAGAASLLGAANAELAAVGAAVDDRQRKEMLGGAKKVVVKLMTYLEQQHTDETSKKKFCEAALVEKEDDVTGTSDEIEGLQAKIGSKTATVESLESEVQAIEYTIQKMTKTVEEATVLRKSQKALYTSGSRDRALAIKVLGQARRLLKKFYETADQTALLEASPGNTPPETWAGSSRKTVSGMNVLGLVDKIVEDIEQEQKDAGIEETQASQAYAQLLQQSKDDFDSGMEDVTGRVKQRAALLVQTNHHKETETARVEQLDAIKAELKDLHGQCDTLLQNFDARVKARSFEVSQLRDVLDILSGSEIAARTGLL